jgi:hypothetical protein
LSLKVQAVTYVDHLVSQFAGEIGLISIGLGRDFSRYSIAGMYGIVPPEMSGTSAIETVTLRQTYRFHEWKRLSFHVGLNVYHVTGLNYETSKYGDPPDRYYPIGSIRGLLSLGTAVQIDRHEKSFFYFESGINDIWMVNWLANYKVVNPWEHFSLAMGFKQRF